jgi:hypothetical protein
MKWLTTQRDISDFISVMQVRPPGIAPEGFDDRLDYDELVEYANSLGDDGKLLLEALRKLNFKATTLEKMKTTA